MKTKKLSHVDEEGKTKMVDVSKKQETERVARAYGEVQVSPPVLELIIQERMPKGEVIPTARLAGIMAAKKTPGLIPLCHPLRITHINVDIRPDHEKSSLHVVSTVKATDKTGAEMEALTAVAIACLTLYDMCKGVDKRIVIREIHLVEKKGGKSGEFRW